MSDLDDELPVGDGDDMPLVPAQTVRVRFRDTGPLPPMNLEDERVADECDQLRQKLADAQAIAQDFEALSLQQHKVIDRMGTELMILRGRLRDAGLSDIA